MPLKSDYDKPDFYESDRFWAPVLKKAIQGTFL